MIGYIQKQIPTHYAQTHCSGITVVVNNPAAFKRTLDFKTYRLLTAVLNSEGIVFNEEARALIENKVETYEDLLKKAHTDIPALFQISDARVIISNELYCPISQLFIESPVIAADGYHYDKHSIATWLVEHDSSPISNMVLDSKNLYPDTLLKKVLSDIHTAIETLYKKMHALKVQPDQRKPVIRNSKIPILRKESQYAGYKSIFVAKAKIVASVEMNEKIDRYGKLQSEVQPPPR